MPTILWMVIVLSLALSPFTSSEENSIYYDFSFLWFFLFSQFIYLFFKWVTYVTTEQVLTNKRVFYKEGIIRRDTEELKKDAIETISTKQSVLGRLLNFGEIEFTGRGGISFKFIFIRNPTEIKKAFENSL